MTENRKIHMDSGNYNENIKGDYIQGDQINYADLESLQKWKQKAPPPQKIAHFLPDSWGNWESRTVLEKHGLGVKCDDMKLGKFRVYVLDIKFNEIVHMEGENNDKYPKIKVIRNQRNYSRNLLENIFHMARCDREYLRTKKSDYAYGCEYFREKVNEQLSIQIK